MTTGIPTNDDRWQARRAAASWLRTGIFLVPFLTGFGAGAAVAAVLPEPRTVRDIVAWWTLVVAASAVTATLTDRLARRLLPMAALLRMTMLFPDRAPTRMRVALRAGNVTRLRERVVDSGPDSQIGEMAESIISLATALSHHDRRTRGHSERTRAYTDLLAEEMGLDEEERDKLRWAALLHDVGKLEIPTEILNKAGSLTEEEWEQVRRHPVTGMGLVEPLAEWLGPWAQTIEHHHERWDGTGYPHGVSGTDIALGARIVAVADAYDVMTSGRSYQKAKTPAAARAEIATGAGSQFDPAVVRALMNVALGKLRWSTGPLAWLADLPLVRGLPDIGRDTASLLTSSAVLATSIATGMVTTPVQFTVSDAAEVMEFVISGGDLSAIGLPFPSGPEDPEPTSTTTSSTISSTTTSSSTTSSTVATTPEEAGEGSAPPDPEPATTSTTTQPGNRPPVARADSAVTDEDTPTTVNVLANDSDPDGRVRPESLHIVTDGRLGTATVAAGSVRYAPGRDAHGTDRFTYRVCDGEGGCAEAEVVVTIRPVNDAPVGGPAKATVPDDTLLELPLTVTDPDGDPVSCRLAGSPATGAATVPADCSKLVYQPAVDRPGPVDVTIEASDGAVSSRFTVTVTVTAVNDAPVAVDDTASTLWNKPVDVAVLGNDTDPDGDPLTVKLVTKPSAGSAAVTGGGAIRYRPAVGASGVHTVTYEACDPSGACSRAKLRVEVSGFTEAFADAASTVRNGGVEVDVRANDVPGTGVWADSAITVVEQPDWGGTQVRDNRRIMYWPTRGWTGTDSFVYRICDSGGSCATTTVTVVVSPRR